VLPLREILPARGASAALSAQAPTPTSPPNPIGAPKLSPQSQAEADFRFQAILSQYPDRFSEAQKTDLRRLCVLLQPPLDRIRAYAISNGDLPALYLKPLVDRDKKPATSSPPKALGAAKPAAPSQPKSAKP
jgi:hypothetical protein